MLKINEIGYNFFISEGMIEKSSKKNQNDAIFHLKFTSDSGFSVGAGSVGL